MVGSFSRLMQGSYRDEITINHCFVTIEIIDLGVTETSGQAEASKGIRAGPEYRMVIRSGCQSRQDLQNFQDSKMRLET